MCKHPKRRKRKDNPYTLNIVEEKCIVEFKDNTNEKHQIQISKELFEVFNQFELADLRELNEYDNHIEHLELSESNLYKRMKVFEKNTEEIVIRKVEQENIIRIINKLPLLQRKRIFMYYYDNLTLEEIAKIEKCSKVAVKYNIDKAKKNLFKIIKKDRRII